MEIPFMKTPQEFHESNHQFTHATFEECWQCGKQRAQCKGKRPFSDRWSADRYAQEHNEEQGFDCPLATYRCRWCLKIHLTSTLDIFQMRRVERRRRSWLTKNEVERRAAQAQDL